MAQIHALLTKELSVALNEKSKKSKPKKKEVVNNEPKTTQATVTQPLNTTLTLGTTPASLLTTVESPLTKQNDNQPSLLQYLQQLYKPKPKLKYIQKLGFEPPESSHPKVTNTSMLTKSLVELKNRFAKDMLALSGVHSLPEYTSQAWLSYLNNVKYPFLPQEYIKPFLNHQKPLYAITYSASIPKQPIQLKNLTSPILNKFKAQLTTANPLIGKKNPPALALNPAVKIPNSVFGITKPVVKYPNPVIALPNKNVSPLVSSATPAVVKPISAASTGYSKPVTMNTIVNENNNNNKPNNQDSNNPNQQLIDKYIEMYQNFRKRPRKSGSPNSDQILKTQLLAKQMLVSQMLKKQALTSLTQNLMNRPIPPSIPKSNIENNNNIDGQNYTHLMNDISGILQKYSKMIDIPPLTGQPVYFGETPKRTLNNVTSPTRNKYTMKNDRSKVAEKVTNKYEQKPNPRSSARSNPAPFLDSHGDLKVVPLTNELFSDLHSTKEMNGISTIIENFIKHEAIHPKNESLVTANKNDKIPDDEDLDDEYVGVDDQVVENKRDKIPNVDKCLQPSFTRFNFNENLKYIRQLQFRMKQDLDDFNNDASKENNHIMASIEKSDDGNMNILMDHDNMDDGEESKGEEEKKSKHDDDDFDDFNMSNFYNNNQGPKLNDDASIAINTQRMNIPRRPNLKQTRENLINTIFIDEERFARQYSKSKQPKQQLPADLFQVKYAKKRDEVERKMIPNLFGPVGDGELDWEDFILR